MMLDRMPLPSAFVEQLTALLGPRFTTARGAREQHGHSETHHRALPPDAVAFPHSNKEVSAIVRACAAHDVPVIPYGVGTSVEGNIAAVRGGLCIDMSEMNKVLAVRQSDLDCTVQAGVRRNQLNTFLRDQGLFFPIDPGAAATIRGIACTRA